MKQLFASLLLTTLSTAVLAATFSGGGGQGTSIVDAVNPVGADYSSLADAAQDFSNSATPVTGDWTLLIRSNLTEPNNVAFGKETGSNQITLKPAPGVSPVITFTTTTLAPSTSMWRGHLVVGTTSTLNLADGHTTTSNFRIDGSNTVGGTTRDLTIKNTMQNIGSIVVRAVGSCDRFEVKNCVIDNLSTGTGTGTEAAGIDLTSRKTAGFDHHPTNALIENCDVRSDVSENGQSIIIRNSGTMTAGSNQTGHVITNNRLSGTYRNIFLSHINNISITSNTMIVNSTNNRPEAINHSSNNGASGWTMNILNNRWDLIKNSRPIAASGINYQFHAGAAGTLAVPVTGTYNIKNNFFGGFDYSGVTLANSGTAILYRPLVQSGNYSAVTMNVEHNSFNMPNFPGVTGFDTTGRIGAVCVTGSTPTLTLNLKNNIIRCEQNNAYAIYLPPTWAGTINSNYNSFHLGTAGARMARVVSTIYTTLSDWKASGRDFNSNSADPTLSVSGSGTWISNSDLHFSAKPVDLFGAPAIGLGFDIDNEARIGAVVYKGADERAEALSLVTAAGDWSLFD